MKKRVLIIVGIILAIIVFLGIGYITRNYIIYSDMKNKFSKNYVVENYSVKVVQKDSDDSKVIFYKKGEKELHELSGNGEEGSSKVRMYNNGKSVNIYVDEFDGNQIQKAAKLNGNIEDMIRMTFPKYDDIKPQITILDEQAVSLKNEMIFGFISTENINGKECYNVNSKYYIEKDTGFVIKYTDNYSISEYKYNSVNDSTFEEPDISQYKIEN